MDFDVKVYTLLGSKATNTTTNTAAGTSITLHIVLQATKYLEQIERRAVQARPLTNGRFIPLVFSAGGMMFEATRKELEIWGEKLEANTFRRMKTMVSIALLKARTRSFETGRPGDMGNALQELSGDF